MNVRWRGGQNWELVHRKIEQIAKPTAAPQLQQQGHSSGIAQCAAGAVTTVGGGEGDTQWQRPGAESTSARVGHESVLPKMAQSAPGTLKLVLGNTDVHNQRGDGAGERLWGIGYFCYEPFSVNYVNDFLFWLKCFFFFF